MLRQFLTLKVALELLGAAMWGLFIWRASVALNKNETKRTLKADYLKTPTGNALTVLGLTVPILVALISYLYTNDPVADYGSLLSTTTLYFFVLLVAIWQTFAIMKKAKESDTIELDYPADRRFITGLGLMYGMLILGLFYFASFFLFEVATPKPREAVSLPSMAAQPILRAPLHVNISRDDVIRAWGLPARSAANNVEYDTPTAVVKMTFDKTGILQTITETKR